MSETENEVTEQAKPAKGIEAGRHFEETILRMAEERGPGKSFTPSEVAQALAEEWRPLLNHIRAAARRLAEAGRIEILRHGKPADPAALRGVIRLRLKPPAVDGEAHPDPQSSTL